MVSEGTDIPRLQVCCHISRVKTELYFRQVLGRILRVNNAVNQEAWLYTFAEPQLCEFANRLKEDIPDSNVMFEVLAQDKLWKVHENKLVDTVDIFNKIEKPGQENFKLGDLKFTTITASPLSLSGHSSTEILLFLGRFKEKMIAVFESPF